MSTSHIDVALVHGAWADGSSWRTVIGPLKADGINVVAAPLPLTFLADDVATLERVLERLDGPVVLIGHAYAGAVIAATRGQKVASLVYVWPAPHQPAGLPGTRPLVTFARSGISTPFDTDKTSVLELAEACDISTRWSCRTGACHTCTTPPALRRRHLPACAAGTPSRR
jgi:pimeloyl-ACP methyl ester carboxylesterase